MEENKPVKKPRGFAAISKERQQEIASMGGVAAHQMGKAHEFTSEQAREAGRKGGVASGARRREKRSQSAECPNTVHTGPFNSCCEASICQPQTSNGN